MLDCDRCGESFDTANGHTGIHFVEGETPAEQVRTGRVAYLCPGCAEKLRAWLWAMASA
jgi:hypothetical protein